MKDATLSVSKYLPAAGANNTTDIIDLHVDGDAYGNAWRLGRIRVAIPALPNNTDNTKTITIDMEQQPAAGGAYAVTVPLIRIQVPGVASTGSAALAVDCPLPPLLTGPVKFLQTVPAGAGDNTAANIQYDWVNE